VQTTKFSHYELPGFTREQNRALLELLRHIEKSSIRPYAQFRLTSAEPVAHATDENLEWDAFSDSQPPSDWPFETFPITSVPVPNTGLWRAEAGLAWPTNATGYRQLDIVATKVAQGGTFPDGSVTIFKRDRRNATGSDDFQNLSTTLFLEAGDTVNVLVRQTSTVELSLSANYRTYMILTGVAVIPA
jgi:hypothetical protein